MNETLLHLTAAFVAGALLGIVFFGGLHWTLRRYLSSPHAWLFLTGSMILRLGLAAAVFYLVGQGDWQRLLACLMGFVIARTSVVRLTDSTQTRSL